MNMKWWIVNLINNFKTKIFFFFVCDIDFCNLLKVETWAEAETELCLTREAAWWVT